MIKVILCIIYILFSYCSFAGQGSGNKFMSGQVEALDGAYRTEEKIKKIENNSIARKSMSDKAFELQAEKIAKELQDVLASKLLNTMYEGIKPNKLFGGGSAERMYQSLLNDERSKVMDLGLVKPIKKQIISLKQGKEVYNRNEPKPVK